MPVKLNQIKMRSFEDVILLLLGHLQHLNGQAEYIFSPPKTSEFQSCVNGHQDAVTTGMVPTVMVMCGM